MKLISITTQSKNFPSAKLLLESFGLQTSDISDITVKLWAIEEDRKLIGVIGIEQLENIGLLRSLAIAKDYQGLGLANRLCDAVFTHSVENNIKEIYLLTESASRFFAHKGFTEIARTTAPDGLRKTSQFSFLCPDSATVMIRKQCLKWDGQK